MLAAQLRRSTGPTLSNGPLHMLRRWEHVFTQLPEKWHRLRVPTLEVMDTSELHSLQNLLKEERQKQVEQHAVAKESQRKTLRVNCELDIKRIDRVNQLVDLVLKDSKRTW